MSNRPRARAAWSRTSRTIVACAALSLLGFASPLASPLAAQAPADAPAQKPNILLVLLDDVGFMDFGAYGSNTATPNIDALGRAGVMFTRYYTHPLCGPSRASLMTGQDNHLVGAGTLSEALTEEMHALPAYNGVWKESQQTIATHLKGAGYQTFVVGKWGIGHGGTNPPNRFGFDRSFVLDATGGDNYEAKPYVPLYKEVFWTEDGQRVKLPDDFYSPRNIVDKAISYIDQADSTKPFFAYVAFQAVHMPNQAPREYVDKYNGVFDRGWDVMRQERLQRAIELGLVPEGTRLSPTAYDHRRWNDLTPEEQRYWARSMQVNAGMMDAADEQLGRLLAHLKAKGELDNTIIVVASDNGPESNTVGKISAQPLLSIELAWLAVEGWDNSYENLGQRGSHSTIGPEWATVSAAPFHLYKFNATEGGLRVPMVVAGPSIASRGFVDGRAMVADIAPTLLSFAGVTYQPTDFYGRSLAPILTGQAPEVYGEDESFAFETSGASALYRGRWKITRTLRPLGDDKWHLYDIAVDPGETTDRSAEHPELFREMIAEFDTYAKRVGVYEMPPGQSASAQIRINSVSKIAQNYWQLLLLCAVALLALLYAVVRGVRAGLRAMSANRPRAA